MAYVEFSVMVEKWVCDVRLNYCCFYLAIRVVLLLKQTPRNLRGPHEFNSCSSIGTFSWLNNPNLLLVILLLCLQKIDKTLVFSTLKMISFWDDSERIYLLYISIVMFHGVEQSFFGANEAIIWNMVSDCQELLWIYAQKIFFGMNFKMFKMRFYLIRFRSVQEYLFIL